jgi:hypothetical protein
LSLPAASFMLVPTPPPIDKPSTALIVIAADSSEPAAFEDAESEKVTISLDHAYPKTSEPSEPVLATPTVG